MRRLNFAILIGSAIGILSPGPAYAAETWSYWIQPCTPVETRSTDCRPGDVELARWALESWQRDSGGALVFEPGPAEEHARVRIHWAAGTSSLYGETQPIVVDGRRGANIFVLPDVRELGRDVSEAAFRDPVLREAIVYLTCVHETGHALGLAHTANFADIMYSFQFGGDIVGYFERYRGELNARDDIRVHAGTSEADRTRLRALMSHERQGW